MALHIHTNSNSDLKLAVSNFDMRINSPSAHQDLNIYEYSPLLLSFYSFFKKLIHKIQNFSSRHAAIKLGSMAGFGLELNQIGRNSAALIALFYIVLLKL